MYKMGLFCFVGKWWIVIVIACPLNHFSWLFTYVRSMPNYDDKDLTKPI